MADTSERYVVGIDFGTLSGRAVVVRVSDGAEVGAAVHPYPHGVISERLPANAGGGDLPPAWAARTQDPMPYATSATVSGWSPTRLRWFHRTSRFPSCRWPVRSGDRCPI